MTSKHQIRQRRTADLPDGKANHLMNRRLWCAVAAAGVAGTAYLLLRESEAERTVREFVENFPADELPGNPVVTIHSNRGAEFCLVNFENFHSVRGIENDEASKQHIINVQEDRLKLIQWCLDDDRLDIEDFYPEGWPVETFRRLKEAEQAARVGIAIQASQMPPEERGQFLAERRRELLYQVSAEGLLSFENKLRFRPSETKELNKPSLNANEVEAAFVPRQNWLLDRIRTSKQSINYTSWGAAHWQPEDIPADFSIISIRSRVIQNIFDQNIEIRGTVNAAEQ